MKERVETSEAISVPSALNPIAFDAQDNILFQNNGDGAFSDVTAALGVEANGGRSMQAIFTDFDLDWRPRSVCGKRPNSQFSV